MSETTTAADTSTEVRRRKLSARAAQAAGKMAEQEPVEPPTPVASQLATPLAEEQVAEPEVSAPVQQTNVQPDVQASSEGSSSTHKRRRKNTIDTTALMDSLKKRSSFAYTENKQPMNGGIEKRLIDGLDEFCRLHTDANGKPIKRYLVLSKLIDELLHGSELMNWDEEV